MKTLKQKFASLSLSILVIAASVLSAVPVYAASASITLNGNKSTVANGGSYIVAVYMNGGGTPVYGVKAIVNYPASKLQYVGLNYSGSAFEIGAAGGGGDGSISIDRGTVSPVSGSALVATITFRAIVGSGSASLNIDPGSGLGDGSASTSSVPFNPGSDSVNFGIAAAATPSAAGPYPAPAPPAPPKDTTPPVISKVTVKTKTPYSAVIDWTTDEPSDSAIDYGVDGNYGLSASQPGLMTSHEVSLSSSFLTPKLLLHYRVKSADDSGNVQTGTDQALQLPGVPVTVVVRADNGKPQPNADVTLDNQTATTDAKGQANLTASLGSKQVVITYNGITIRRPITIGRATKPLPPYQLDLAKQPLNRWMLTSVGLIVIVLTLLGLDLVLFGSTFVMKLVRWRHRGYHTPQSLAAAHVTHDSGTALFSTLDQRVFATAPVIRTDGNLVIADVAPVTQSPGLSAPVVTPEITKQIPKQILVTETDYSPAASVAQRLKTRASVDTTAKPSKIKKSTAASGKTP